MGVGFLKKDFTVAIIPSPYMCCFTYFPISGLYFLLNSDCLNILFIELYKCGVAEGGGTVGSPIIQHCYLQYDEVAMS